MGLERKYNNDTLIEQGTKCVRWQNNISELKILLLILKECDFYHFFSCGILLPSTTVGLEKKLQKTLLKYTVDYVIFVTFYS